MVNQKNIEKVTQLTELIQSSKSIVLADYSGLTVKQQNELRRKIKQSGGTFMVAKNRLFKLACKQCKIEQVDLEKFLEGTTAFLFVQEDEIQPIKALVKFSESNDLPKTKIGIMLKPEDRILSVEEIQTLANLPAKEQLIAKLIGSLNSPKYRLINSLAGNISKLTNIIKAISNKKSSAVKN